MKNKWLWLAALAGVYLVWNKKKPAVVSAALPGNVTDVDVAKAMSASRAAQASIDPNMPPAGTTPVEQVSGYGRYVRAARY